ncbi:unnamed protein product [Gongylonema pulchrum]|uniref:T2SSF domain-containing protein n=1 Tax=Gongylonema pulchrum TaxID=637853 RepID=A0A183CW73_9BILA|nr:unnamed protein product [Gongylonema pulchrum]
MDSVLQLVNQYRNEFQYGYGSLRKNVASICQGLANKNRPHQNLSRLQQELLKQRDEMLATIKDTQSVLPELDTTKLMGAFSWMGIMLLGLSIGAIVGGILLQPVLELFISGVDAALIAYLILPAAAFYCLQLPIDANEQNDLLRRHALFLFAVFEGLLTGYIFANRGLIGVPPLAALTPMAIGLFPHIGQSTIGKDRMKLICMAIGGGMMLHLCMGTIVDLSLPYFLLAGLYALIGFAVLQLYVNSAGKDLALTHMYQLSFVCAVIFSQALVYAVFGLDEKELAEASRSSSFFL